MRLTWSAHPQPMPGWWKACAPERTGSPPAALQRCAPAAVHRAKTGIPPPICGPISPPTHIGA